MRIDLTAGSSRRRLNIPSVAQHGPSSPHPASAAYMPIRSSEPTRPSSIHSYEEQAHSWTDDLPVCRQSGVGLATNQIYREDGYRQEDHEFEDRSFHFCLDEQTYLYGVFDGHEGVQAAAFALQRTAAEIILGQLAGKTADEEIKDVLRQAFIAVEKGYLDSIDDKLAERTSLQCEIPEGLRSYEAYQQYPQIVDRLKALNVEISSGTTAVVALVYRKKLYVANVGDSRALLCRIDNNGVLCMVQLSMDHDLSNEDELLRLKQLGLNTDVIRHGCRLGNQENTRCIGNYFVKGGYKESEELSSALSEPVIAEPEIVGGISLDDSRSFLLLMSGGLYKSLKEATSSDNDQINKEIAQLTVEQFRTQATLAGVAQAVVDRVVSRHRDTYLSGTATFAQRDDITLLVRNFNFPMPNALNSPTIPSVRFASSIPTSDSSSLTATSTGTSSDSSTVPPSNMSTSDTSSDTVGPMFVRTEPGRIPAYVDFTSYYSKVAQAREEGKLTKDTAY